VEYKIDLKPALKKLERDLTYLQREQLPFAAATALNTVAAAVIVGEKRQLAADVDRPTPFTLNAFGMKKARKTDLEALVFIKDIQAKYLAPMINGGRQITGKGGANTAILTPRDLPTNQYGNIPKAKLQALAGRKDIFIGQVKTKNGMIGGVWQRVGVTKAGKVKTKGVPRGTAYTPSQGRLILLIQFTRPSQVTHRFHYYERADSTVKRAWPAAFQSAMRQAMATAR